MGAAVERQPSGDLGNGYYKNPIIVAGDIAGIGSVRPGEMPTALRPPEDATPPEVKAPGTFPWVAGVRVPLLAPARLSSV